MTPIEKLLIANRGEIARRVIRTAKAMRIATVAVFSDADAAAAHVVEADEAVRLPGSAAGETYLRGELIIDAAHRTGADAVHPGYGFLSESARFVRSCEAAGLTFVGPSADVVELMGSKIEAKRIMTEVGVPVLECVDVTSVSDDALRAAAERIGFPVLVKAAFGGGGRGMRRIDGIVDLRSDVDSATREATAAFGDGTVFLERFIEAPRHIEVQVIGDHDGNVAHLFERECSIQRRHQKVIEEAPSPAVDDELRAALCTAAVAAGKAIGYAGAGTVEFIVAPDGRFWFLEMNTRLQVEHPVTELITGLDLVQLQLLVAQGHALPPQVVGAAVVGHAIEARLYAEDVSEDFRPTSGRIHRIRIEQKPTLRVDAGYVDGSDVTTHYDAMLAKVVAWAPTRTEAALSLAGALARAHLHGPLTNRDLLVRTLRHPEFLGGKTDTGFIDTHALAGRPPSSADSQTTRLHAVAAAIAVRATARTLRGVRQGWRNVGTARQPRIFRSGDETLSVICSAEHGRLRVWIDDAELEDVHLWFASGDLVDVSVAAVRRRYNVHRRGDVCYVDSPLGASVLHEEPRFAVSVVSAPAGSLVSPLPGTVVAVAVREGDHVSAADSLVTLEAMKMEHLVSATEDGIVTAVHVRVGDQVETGDLLVVLETRDLDCG